MSDIEHNKSRSIWELFSDFLREAAVLLWVFGVVLDHDHKNIKHGMIMTISAIILFYIGLICEKKREIKTKKDLRC